MAEGCPDCEAREVAEGKRYLRRWASIVWFCVTVAAIGIAWLMSLIVNDPGWVSAVADIMILMAAGAFFSTHLLKVVEADEEIEQRLRDRSKTNDQRTDRLDHRSAALADTQDLAAQRQVTDDRR